MTIDMKQHEAAVDAVLAKLKAFLMTPDHGDGSWPDISREGLDTAHTLTREMLDLKWGEDCDGDAPVSVRMWSRRQVRPICEWAYIAHEPRDDSEADDERHARLLSNLSSASSASAAAAEAMRQIHIEMADIHNRKLRQAAMFEVHFVHWTPPADWDCGRFGLEGPVSLHLTVTDAEQFIAEQTALGLTFSKRAVMRATPSHRDSPSNGFADYRAKVQAECGKLVHPAKTQNELNLSFGRSFRTAAAAQ
jgi:hypothetical protein